ncbi:DUF1279 super [Conoideocrella luteorostrata]|uniref:DUF1279 super n=1 Tax=Conoideocrella luteorostrata TaxID=1105319 RepID=A0AAJ0G1X2_9HYPO|nr:DUF1279 super [Conoideocrella luteorostrata]
MFRTAFGIRSLPVQGGLPQTTSSLAWNNIWRRMLNTKPGQRMFTCLKTGQIQQARQLRGSNQHIGSQPSSAFARIQRRSFRFSPWRRNTTSNGTQEKLTLSQKLKKLSKEYGWSAVGVYLALSVLDFPFCFLLVRIVGTDKIGQVEHYVVSSVKQFIPEAVRQKWHEYWHSIKSAEVDALGNDHISDKVEMAGWGVKEAQEHHAEEASLGTQLALAYAIHKSFIFFRVPLTAAVTPKVVKVLRSWGWNIGKRVPR